MLLVKPKDKSEKSAATNRPDDAPPTKSNYKPAGLHICMHITIADSYTGYKRSGVTSYSYCCIA